MISPSHRRLLLWLPAALALALVVAWLFRPAPVAVDFAVVARGPLRVTVSDEGETRVRDVFVVSAPVPGLMRRIELEPGDPVSAHETVVAQIEPGDPSLLDVRSDAEARAGVQAAEAAQAYAKAEMTRAAAELDFARSELRRFSGLAEHSSISANDLDAARRRERIASAGLDEAKARLNVQTSELARARARLLNPRSRRPDADCACVNVHSPVTGQVLRVLKESEGVVASGTPLLEVGDPRNLEIVVDLLSTDAVLVRPGQRVQIEGWGGPGSLEGAVRRVEPFGFTKISALGIEEQRVNVIIDLVAPPERWRSLGHGYRVEPNIVLWESDDALQVPLSALFRAGERWAVYVERGGRAELRTVEIGQQNGLAVQILGGLEGGERVVVHPSDRVSVGSRLEKRG